MIVEPNEICVIQVSERKSDITRGSLHVVIEIVRSIMNVPLLRFYFRLV